MLGLILAQMQPKLAAVVFIYCPANSRSNTNTADCSLSNLNFNGQYALSTPFRPFEVMSRWVLTADSARDVIYSCPRSHKTIDKLFWWFNTLFLAVCFFCELGFEVMLRWFFGTLVTTSLQGKPHDMMVDFPRVEEREGGNVVQQLEKSVFFADIARWKKRCCECFFFLAKGQKKTNSHFIEI